MTKSIIIDYMNINRLINKDERLEFKKNPKQRQKLAVEIKALANP